MNRLLEGLEFDHDSFPVKMDPEACAQRRQRNSFAPINCLPGEIFVAILLSRMKDAGILGRWRALQTLAQVCTYWANTILQSPCFWDLLIPEPRWSRDMVLKRNTTSLLDVRCVHYRKKEDMDVFMELATPLSERWRTLELRGPISEQLRGLMTKPTPHLSQILLSNADHTLQSVVMRVTEGRNIEYLDLTNVDLSWGSARLRGLRALRLRSINCSTLSSNNLRAMLASSPMLWYLDLTNWLFLDTDSTLREELSTLDPPAINLPHLTTLIVGGVPPPITQLLLSSVVAPACRSIVLRGIPSPIFSAATSTRRFAGILNAGFKGIKMVRLISRKQNAPLHMLSQPLGEIPYTWSNDTPPTFNVQFAKGQLPNAGLGPLFGLLTFPETLKVITHEDGVIWEPALSFIAWHRIPKLEIGSARVAEIVSAQLAQVDRSDTSRRLRLFKSPLSSSRGEREHSAVVRNLAVFAQVTQRRRELSGTKSFPSFEVSHQPFQIEIPATCLQYAHVWLQDWDVQLTALEQRRF